MPELRRDPVVGYWTIISTERSRRPVEYKPAGVPEEPECPFCEGREPKTTPEIYAVRKSGTPADGPGWEVRVVPSKTPMLGSEPDIARFGEGIYDLMNGVGRHEILIENPMHCHDLDEMTLPHLENVIAVYRERLNQMASDTRLKYALLFKNHGQMIRSRQMIRHSRSQLIGMPIIPKRVKEELVAVKNYFDRRERCVFCDILRQESSEGLRMVYQNESFFAFCPFASRTPFEIWILPKKHSADFGRIDPSDFRPFAQALKSCLAKIRVLLGDPPFNFILHTAPYRHKKKEAYWKTIEEDYHWYLLISPRLTHLAGFEWGTGIHINPTAPEDAALLLRETEI